MVVEYQPTPLALSSVGTKSVAIAVPTALEIPVYTPYRRKRNPNKKNDALKAKPANTRIKITKDVKSIFFRPSLSDRNPAG